MYGGDQVTLPMVIQLDKTVVTRIDLTMVQVVMEQKVDLLHHPLDVVVTVE